MAGITSVGNKSYDEQIKKPQAQNTTDNTTQNTGSVFANDTWTTADDMKARNGKALQSLDSGAQDIIKSHFENKSWSGADGGWGDMNKMADDLNANGYTAKVVQNAANDNGKNIAYLEVTDKNGNKTKLWDANGDGGFGNDDMDFNAQIKDFGSSLKNQANGASGVDGANGIGKTSHVAALNPTQDTQNTKSDNQNNKTDNQFADYLLKLLLKSQLQAQGFKGKELETKLEELINQFKFFNSSNN